jgi:dephospho-CoA kinase
LLICAESQNRTGDTTIFSRVLYQLSYLGRPVALDLTGCILTTCCKPVKQFAIGVNDLTFCAATAKINLHGSGGFYSSLFIFFARQSAHRGVIVSKWAGKYVIGLTGNIGTGKSVVRRMLEHMGALGIDADSFSHRAIAKGAPGYRQVVDTFGRWVLSPDGEVDRVKLGRLVFSDKEALAQLEAIIHPLVLQAVDWMIQRSDKQVVVIEAIKLLESDLRKQCDSIWVVYAQPEAQIARLVQKRRMGEAEARQRINAQGSQEQKMGLANVVVKNTGSFEDTWRQVAAAWQKEVPVAEVSQAAPTKSAVLPQGDLTVARARPRDAAIIASLISRVRKDSSVTTESIMDEFGDKAFLLLRVGDQLVGVSGWQVENLVARTTDIVLDASVPYASVLPALVNELERASRDLQCEASLITAPQELSADPLWKSLGYDRRTPQSLGVAVWQEAARDMLKPGLSLYFKQLRQDRVLRPI